MDVLGRPVLIGSRTNVRRFVIPVDRGWVGGGGGGEHPARDRRPKECQLWDQIRCLVSRPLPASITSHTKQNRLFHFQLTNF